MSKTNAYESKDFARRIRAHALRMVAAANASHIGSCLSMADILAVLYAKVLRVDPDNPQWSSRDRFILSKGHAAAILYAALAERGFFPLDELATFCSAGSILTGHISHAVPGVEVSTGSLGHGLPIAVGMALAARANSSARVFCVLSDGECDEGSNWEAILFAGHHKLDNLTVVVDYNKIQSFGRVSDVLELHPFAEKWRAFRWETTEVDGHDHSALEQILDSPNTPRPGPLAVIAHTIKGKGVSFMEDRLQWHYSSPNPSQLQSALEELDA